MAPPKKPFLCKACGEMSPDKFSEYFNSAQNRWVRYKSECKKCMTARKRPYEKKRAKTRIRNTDVQRRYYLRNRYGLTEEAYTELLESQECKCAICKSMLRRENIDIDHNHSTGEVRGILCSRCNKMLGFAEDDIHKLEKAIEYLKERGW